MSDFRIESRASTSSSGSDPLYIGDPNTNGSWRLTISSTELLVERRESGVWVEKSAFLP